MTRENIISLINELKLCGEGVEVGVQKGHFSRKILSDTKLSRLYSVDAWRTFDHEEYPEFGNVPRWKHVIFYLQTRYNLRKFGERSVILNMLSIDASILFADNSLDFVFIDANHSYKAVRKDLEVWFPKVKHGGLFSGDDYLNGIFHYGSFGVKQAVDEFVQRERSLRFKQKNLKLNVLGPGAEFPLWYMIK